MYKFVTYSYVNFAQTFLLKFLFFFLIVIVVVSFDRLALFRYTFNRCELLCNFIIT